MPIHLPVPRVGGLVLCLLVAACGGGGGGSGGGAASAVTPFPTASEDILPAGQRIDVSAQNLFPSGPGDVWTYSQIEASGAQGAPVQQSVTGGPDANGRISVTTDDGTGPDVSEYVVSADGVLDLNPLGSGTPAGAAAIVGAIFEYMTPLYPQGSLRRHIRSGPWGEDLDGDGAGESFRFEFTQEFLGFESLSVSGSAALSGVAHFRNVYRTTLRPTRQGFSDYTVEIREETWYAPDLGLVKVVGSGSDSIGGAIYAPYTYLLTAANVGGTNWSNVPPPVAPDGTVHDVQLVHNALVYDHVNNLYYASVPGSVAGSGNSIATIDPVTRQVTYSAPIGPEPNALALADDATALYVGLDGPGKVVKLALPAMTEQGSAALPPSVFGKTTAESIAVSPVDANVVAVSLARPGISPSHGGVVLLRSMTVQPVVTADHTGSNLIAFDAAGSTLYGLGAEGGAGLRRISVLPDGLAVQAEVKAAAAYPTTALGVAGNRIIAGRTLHAAPGLEANGLISAAQDCRLQRSGSRLVCLQVPDLSGQARLLIADPTTFVSDASLLVATREPVHFRRRLVEGPANQVAISYTDSGPGSVSLIRLFSSALLGAPPAPPAPSWNVTTSVTADGVLREIRIRHNAVVYDAQRDLYYASVPGSVLGSGNSIATIDPATGQVVTQSAPVGSEPDALALSADGNWLFVGLNGSGEVARLALPSLAEQGRARLISSSNLGQARAEMIAVSPVDSTVAAVSMAWSGVTPRNAGVALLRNLVLQPNRTAGHLASNMVAFDATGSTLYGLSNETGDFGPRRIAVLVDGLAEEAVGTEEIGYPSQAIAFAGGKVIAGRSLYSAPALDLLGSVADAFDCVPARSGPLVCRANPFFFSGQLKVLIADPSTLVIGSSLLIAATDPQTASRILQGPAGQVSISYPVTLQPSDAQARLLLFSSTALP